MRKVLMLALVAGLMVGCAKKDNNAANTKKAATEEIVMSLTMPNLDELTFQQGEEGLEYAVMKKGDGEKFAEKGNRLQMHYSGWFTDGKMFDSSVKRNQPFEFVLDAGMVIRGWDLGVFGMKEGDIRLLKLPYQLAYGEMGHPAGIPPKSDLVFQVELLKVLD